jgi:hypothetical protein
MAREVSTNGRKKVSTLQKEFNENFPYLWLYVCPASEKEKYKDGGIGGAIASVDVNKTLSELRTKKGSGEISFTGSKNIKTIENEFESIFGLFIQIVYKNANGDRFYTTGEDDKTSLSELNRKKAAAGCLDFKGKY